MTKPKITEVTGKVVDLLTPFDSAERQRIIHASLMLLGDESFVPKASGKGGGDAGSSEAGGSGVGGDGGTANLPGKAKTWATQNGLKMADLEQVFHFDNGTVEVIAGAIPGKNKRVQTHNAYVIQGLSKFLASGDSAFDDKSARALCNTFGCYDAANHAVSLGAIGNVVSGSKDKGWKLTAPGLTQGAALVKEMIKKTE